MVLKLMTNGTAQTLERQNERTLIDRYMYLTGRHMYTVEGSQMWIPVVLTYDVAHVARVAFVDRYRYTIVYAAIP